jgi:hypothetical protein
MAVTGQRRRWIVVGLVAFGVVLAAIWPRGGSDDATEDQDSDSSEAWAPPKHEAVDSTAQLYGSDGGVASRRIADNCDPMAESLKYEEFIGTRARAILSWKRMSAQAAGIEIPVQVVGIEDGSIGVRFRGFPMSPQYVAVWLQSGHIRAAEEGVFLLDPCSAAIVAEPEETPAMAAEEYEREDEEDWPAEDRDLEDEDPEDAEPPEEPIRRPWPVNVGNPADFAQ